MLVVVLILLLLAAAAGVLGAVLEAALIIVLSIVLSVILLGWLGLWYAKRRMRRFQRDVQGRIDQARQRRDAYDVPTRRDELRGGG